jgi:hypothetical protein
MSDLRGIIERHVEEILAEVRERVLADLRVALGGEDVPRSATGAASSSRARPRLEPPPGESRQRRTPKELQADGEKLLEAIRSKPGANAEQLREVTGLSHDEMVLPIRKLLAEQSIRKRGEKRATRYFVA